MNQLSLELNKISMHDICNDMDIQEGLAELRAKLGDWFAMISPRKRPTIIRERYKNER